MSTTPASAPAPTPKESVAKRADQALTFFEEAIWHNHEVCSHCFARLRKTSELQLDDWGNVVEETTYAAAATDGFDLEDPPETVASTHPLARERIVCEDCGSVGGLASGGNLSLDEAVERVPALVDRVQEAGYEIDVDVVYDTVRHLKSTDDYRNDEKRIFAVAAYLGRTDT